MYYKVVIGYEELFKNHKDFVELFSLIFQRPYPLNMWNHFYRDIPIGQAAGIQVINEGRLVGFSALLPQRLEDKRTGRFYDYGLNVATMVLPEYRNGGETYYELYSHLKQVAADLGYEFILAFPNEAGYLPLRGLAKFKLLDEAHLVLGTIGKNGYYDYLYKQHECASLASLLMPWRLSREEYLSANGFVSKIYDGQTQLLDLVSPDEFSQSISGVFPCWKSSGFDNYQVISDYVIRLCYFPLGGFDVKNNLKRSVLLSDVF